MIKIITVLGARPQFIKSSCVSRAIEQHNKTSDKTISEIILHTGQHYDFEMSESFFRELELKKPIYNLDINDCSHGAMTGRMLEKVESILVAEKPDVVIVYGDTNSTLAGALASAKLNIKVAHIEAGLRSFNRKMPEEINRVLVDHVSTLLFCPTETAVKNLNREGIFDGAIEVGDVMYDAALHFRGLAKTRLALDRWGVREKDYVLCTIHRAENTDNKNRLLNILQALNEIAERVKVVLPLHPRTKSKLSAYDLSGYLDNLTVISPVSYLEMLRLEMGAHSIITDSGGVQKEAFFNRIPCLTVRDETEWIETVDLGWNEICGADRATIVKNWNGINGMSRKSALPYGDGQASNKIIQCIIESL